MALPLPWQQAAAFAHHDNFLGQHIAAAEAAREAKRPERIPCIRAIEAPIPKCHTAVPIVSYLEDIGITKVLGQMITEYNKTHSVYEFHATTHDKHAGCDGKCAAAFFCIMPCGNNCDAASCLYYERTGDDKPVLLLKVDKDTDVPKLPTDRHNPPMQTGLGPIYHRGSDSLCDIFLEFPGHRGSGKVKTDKSTMLWQGSGNTRFASKYPEANLSLPGCLATIASHYRYVLDLAEHQRVSDRYKSLDGMIRNTGSKIAELESLIARHRERIDVLSKRVDKAEKAKAKFSEKNEKRQVRRVIQKITTLPEPRKRTRKPKPPPKAKTPAKRRRVVESEDSKTAESESSSSDDDLSASDSDSSEASSSDSDSGESDEESVPKRIKAIAKALRLV
jgi:hypothetical protein